MDDKIDLTDNNDFYWYNRGDTSDTDEAFRFVKDIECKIPWKCQEVLNKYITDSIVGTDFPWEEPDIEIVHSDEDLGGVWRNYRGDYVPTGTRNEIIEQLRIIKAIAICERCGAPIRNILGSPIGGLCKSCGSRLMGMAGLRGDLRTEVTDDGTGEEVVFFPWERGGYTW